MIELNNDALHVSFPEIHPRAKLRVEFQRTLRIPDDGRAYPLPPGLGRFPLRHVDDHADRVPERWIRHGGVLLPMYQSEALWIRFHSSYPFAVKIATGKINAVSGKPWQDDLDRVNQDYVVVPDQPWLDGYCVDEGFIRQFVAMPLGAGYSAEEQLTGEAEFGGIQVLAYPIKAEAFERIERARRARVEDSYEMASVMLMEECDMGLAPGGRMRQEIYDDPHALVDWETEYMSRCFVHLTNSLVWRAVTGMEPPTVPFTAKEYTRHRLPWFEYYDADREALAGSEELRGLKSVKHMGQDKGDQPLPENESVVPSDPIQLGPSPGSGRVREGTF
jgi:hypothetical protein